MATRVKNSPPGKEKGGKSSTIPRPTSSSSSSSTDQKHDSTSSEKRVPNYLKPTRSSAGLASSSDAANKPTLGRRRSFGTSPPPQSPKSRTSAADKPTLARRRSFDHRQPPPQPPKTRISSNPGERHLKSSSSFSAKSSTITSQKGLSGRYYKEPKQPVSVRKNSNGVTKQDDAIKSMKMKAPIDSSSDKIDDLDILQLPKGDQESLLTDEEVTIYAVSKTEIPGEDIEMEDKKHSAIEFEDKEHIEVIQPEPEIQDDKRTNETESSVAATDQIEPSDVKTEEPEDQTSLIEQRSVNTPEPEPSPADNSIDSTKESLASEPEEKDQSKGAVDDANEASEKENEVKEASEPVKPMETEKVKDVAPEQVKQQVPQIAVAKRQLPVQAKKEATVSNDVIEETASKLREQRKNKVKALAGAFETVISLQDK